MNIKKLLFKTSTIATSFALSAAPAFAAEITSENSRTGSHSDNSITTSINHDMDIEQTNNMDVNNNFDISVNSGGNEANDNTGDAEISSGDTDVSLWVSNTGNVNTLRMPMHESGSVESINHQTGSRSDNTIETDIDMNHSISQDNDANFDNDFDIDLDSGNNRTNDNTGDVEIDGGDSSISVQVGNDANWNTIN